MRPVPQIRLTVSPSTTATVPDPAPSKLASTKDREKREEVRERETL